MTASASPSSSSSSAAARAARAQLHAGGRTATIYRLDAVSDRLAELPFTVKVLLENVLRHSATGAASEADVAAMVAWRPGAGQDVEIPFMPGRVLLQDFTGVPAVVDLAAMRDAMADLGGDPGRINPLVPASLVIDHSVQVDRFGSADAYAFNVEREYERNGERYQLLRWAQTALRGFRVVPPGTGIVHQVNLEHLAEVVSLRADETAEGEVVAFPDTLVGTDSHTTMISGLGVLGYGVGGIEAEAVLLGQPLYQPLPRVVGLRLHGALPTGSTATDLVLVVSQMLRAHGVVGAFVEFTGDGLASLALADRATLANMAPEYGATTGIFPIDDETTAYLRLTGRDEAHIALVEAYAREQGLWRLPGATPLFDETLELDLASVRPSLAGPRRPQDRVALGDLRDSFRAHYPPASGSGDGYPTVTVRAQAQEARLATGSVAIAAITSCTNTSNPSVMVGAGLLARNAVARGLSVGPTVKTSLAPGSRAVTAYLQDANLLPPLEQLGFDVVGYGCTTCIGNSGPLDAAVAEAVESNDLVVAAVLSGNRNFEGRIHPLVKASYLASPPLVVAFALAGRVDIDLESEPLGVGSDGQPVMLAEIWPTADEVECRDRRGRHPGALPCHVCQRLRGRRALACPARAVRRPLRVGRGVVLHRRPALLQRADARASAHHSHQRRTRPGRAGRLRDHGPHLTGRQHRRLEPGRPVAAGAGREPRRLQQLWRPARPPRGHDAGHLRQHPPAQRVGLQGRSLDDPPARRRGALHLRRRHALSAGRHARCSSWQARNTAAAARATGPPRAPGCSASAPSWPSPTSASTAPTWWAWASCRCSSCPGRMPPAWASTAAKRTTSWASRMPSRPARE